MVVVRRTSVEQWAERICTQLGKTVESIVEVGRLLVKAKGALKHGEWTQLFIGTMIPMSQATAERYMRIASVPQLSESRNFEILPSSVDTLYALARVATVEPKRLTTALKDGTITPNMKRRAVADLLPAKKTKASRVTSVPTPIAPIAAAIDDALYRTAGSGLYFRIMTMLSDGLDALPSEDQDDVLNMLSQAIDHLKHERQAEASV